MVFKVDGGSFVRKTQEVFKKPEVKQDLPPQQTNPGAASKVGETNFHANNLKNFLNRTADVQKIANTLPSNNSNLSPSAAVDKINNLPVRDINDSAAVREYNRQRAAIADEALKTATPPTREDFKSLNGATADYEYREAKSSYDTQIRQLKDASESAKTDPTKLPLNAALTPSQARDRINQLPLPPLNDKVAVRDYQQQRATIADAALKSATPPKPEDFKNLPHKSVSQ
jgi:hypothetical protein